MLTVTVIVIVVIGLIFLFFNKISNFTEINVMCEKINIDKAFVITLSTDNNRFKRFMTSYNLSIPLEPIISFNTKKPEVAEQFRSLVEPKYFNHMYDFDNGMLRPNHTYFNSGALGCYLGHMMFYERCFKQKLNYAIVFEDNLLFSESFPDDVDKVLQTLGSDFDICFLHCWAHVGDQVKLCTSDDITKLNWTMSGKCYIINVNNMKRFYNLFYPISNHVDLGYEKIIYNGARVYLKHLKSIIIQKSQSLINHGDVLNNQYSKIIPMGIFHKEMKICPKVVSN